MTDAAPEPPADLFQRYVGSVVRTGSEAGPCRDPEVLDLAARCPPRPPGGAFSLFAQALTDAAARTAAGRAAHLRTLIRASEVLETVCVNLFLQPWNRSIWTLKTFTGPFVYFVQSVLSGPTIQSLLASVGYLLHTEDSLSEYRLSEDADPDRAMLVAFELLLVRLECCHLLEILEQDQPEPQVWLQILQRVGFTKSEEAKNDETEVQQEDNMVKEVPLCLEAKHADTSQPRTQHRLLSEDHSIMEMHRTYPDLAIRGRPLLREQPAMGISRRCFTGSSNNDNREHSGSSAAVLMSVCGERDGRKAGDDRSRGFRHRGHVATSQGKALTSSRAGDDLSGPQAFSLHITIKAGSVAEPGEVTAWTQETADQQNENLVKLEDRRTVTGPPVEMMNQVRLDQDMKTKDRSKSDDNMSKDKHEQRMSRNPERLRSRTL
ncbi:uncharacterized protein LOC117523188 isoform X2 [Thalassophryne amazonica]|uniref:uncharacterized protein LOC117523188 isoform X2 n=1 Tax=Thalassophryne amazonica TaxID=390379 RepID=UPI0014726943|nr:uncharacterized protein LOC117523188 isoform X2 [Thalassophryne amazonica]